MNWKIILKSFKHKEMQRRIFAVLGILLAFRFLAHVPVPIGDAETLKQILENVFNANQSELLGFMNILSGGALANFSIMLAGLGPYINASIIMQLLTKAIPKLEQLRKDGESGQKKINQWTRMITFPLAAIQSIGMIYLVRTAAQSIGGVGDITANAGWEQWVLMVTVMTGASMLLMWMGELITEQSLGNGISLIITVGIVAGLPGMISNFWTEITTTEEKWSVFGQSLPINKEALIVTAILLVSVLVLTILVVKLNEAQRRLTINYAKRVQGNRTYGGVTTMLPIKLIAAGVVPIIFAVAFLSVPTFVGQIMAGSNNESWQQIGTNLMTWFQQPTYATFQTGAWQAYIYPAVYFLLVFLFTFFYTSITFNTKEIAENLQKQGGFIEGVRSGLQTEKYLSKVSVRLTLFGALALGFLALTPIIGQMFINSSIALGGTSILILVSVSLETLRAVESRALMITYDQYSRPDFFGGLGDDDSSNDGKKPKRSLFSRIKMAK
jgi:preprotein translocase subunit SecY